MKKAKQRDCHRNVEKGLWNQGEREPSPHTPSVWYLSPVSRGAQCWEEVPSAVSGLLLLWTKQSSFAPDPAQKEGSVLSPGRPCFCQRVLGYSPSGCHPSVPGDAHSHPISAVALAAHPDPGRARSHFSSQGPGGGVRAARQDSFHPGPSARTPEPLQPPPSRSLSPHAPKPSVHSPHFCQSAISNNAILIMSLSCSKFFSRSPRFSGQKFLPLCMEYRLCHALALWSLPIPSPPPNP